MMRRFVTGSAVALGLIAFAPRAEAQEIQLTGPLKGAPAVRQLRLYREGRFEVAPSVSFTLLDEYRRTILVGGRVQYHFTDWLGLGVFGGFGAVSMATDLTEQINSVAIRNDRTAANVRQGDFAEQTARINYLAAPQVTFVPFRGKLSLFQKIFIDADAYLHGGVAFVGIEERRNCGAPNEIPCAPPVGSGDTRSFALESRMAVAPTFGLGLNFYASRFVSVGVEYRALPFSWNRAGFDSRGAGSNANFPDNRVNEEDRTFKFNQMLTLAVGLSFPTVPKTSE